MAIEMRPIQDASYMVQLFTRAITADLRAGQIRFTEIDLTVLRRNTAKVRAMLAGELD